MPPSSIPPVSWEVSTELERVVDRWHQLPLDHALSYAPRVRALAQSLADRVAHATGAASSEVSDHGPATLMDQLTVMVYDVSAVLGAGSAEASAAALDLSRDLANLRRELR